jgi:hypothetical protein
MESIVLLTCWYGPYPWYFTYFIHTISFNPTVKFIIITDNRNEIPDKPDNLQIIYHTITDLKDIFEEKLGFAVNIDSPYKLCDFKPAYGYIFQQYINQYDFWGHTDLDIVFGDIRHFVTDDLLQKFEVISCRHDFTAGYFTLYKNTERCNSLFKRSKDYKLVFTTPQNYWFDEFGINTGKIHLTHRITDKSEHIEKLMNLQNTVESMTHVVYKAVKQVGLLAFFDFMILDGVPGNIRWKSGKVYYKEVYEIMFYHLIRFKLLGKKNILNPIPDEFLFTDNEILTMKSS